MQSNLANLESFNRKLFTVNSTNNEAFAVADIASIAATSFDPRTLAAAQTVAAAKGKFIDLALSRNNPFKPSDQNDGVLAASTTGEASQGSYSLPMRLVLSPFGKDTDGETFTMRVFGVFPQFPIDTEAATYYTFSPLIAITVTLGTIGGTTYGLATGELWAKTIAVVANTDNAAYQLMSGSAWAAFPTGGQIAIATNGARFLYVAVTLNGGTASEMNTFWRSV